MVQGVYVDILLVTNFFVNILLLSLVEAVCGRTKQRWRKVASAFAASLFSLSIFFPPPALGIGTEVTELLRWRKGKLLSYLCFACERLYRRAT